MSDEFDELDGSMLVDEPEAPVAPEAPEPTVQETPAEPPAAPESDDVSDVDPEPQEPATEPQEPAQPSEVELLTQQLNEQREMINKILSGQPLITVPEQPEAPKLTPEQQYAQYVQQVQAAQAQEQPKQEPEAPVDFVDEAKFDEILSDPAAFNGFLREVVAQVREQAVQEAYGKAMQELPSVVLPSVYEASRQQYTVSRWASENPIVTENRQLAATILNQVDGYHPGASTEEKLNITLEQLKRIVGAQPNQAQTPASPTPGVQQPAFATPPRGGVPQPVKLDDLEREMAELSL